MYLKIEDGQRGGSNRTVWTCSRLALGGTMSALALIAMAATVRAETFAFTQDSSELIYPLVEHPDNRIYVVNDGVNLSGGLIVSEWQAEVVRDYVPQFINRGVVSRNSDAFFLSGWGYYRIDNFGVLRSTSTSPIDGGFENLAGYFDLVNHSGASIIGEGTGLLAWSGASPNPRPPGFSIVNQSGATIRGILHNGMDLKALVGSADGEVVIDNAGDILGNVLGIKFRDNCCLNLTLNNTGRIAGATQAGILFEFGNVSTTNYINNDGVIEGATYSIQDNSSSLVLTNRGSLVGDVFLGGGDDTLILRPGAVIDGVVDAGADTDTLRLDASLNVNDGNNPDPGKFLNFEVFEFVEFERQINGDAAETLVANTERDIRFSGASSVVAINIERGGSVYVLASVRSANAIANNGSMLVNSDARVAAPSFAGAGSFEIANGVTFTLDQSENSEFLGQITGAGSLVKEGTGRLRLTADQTITGDIVVRNGVLDVDGRLPGGVIVEQGGRLEGSGVFVSIASSGVIAPGNSPGTLTVGGDLTLTATSTLEIDIDGRTYSVAGGAGSYDRIVLTGATSTFTAGGTLEPILRGITGAANNDFTPVYGDAFTLVTTANPNGVSGTFATVAQPADGLPANARFDVLYFANRVDAVVTPGSYATFASSFVGTSNAQGFGQALDVVRPAAGANPDTAIQTLFTNLYPLNGTQLASAFGALSGEIHAFAVNDARDSVETLWSNSYVGGLTPQARGRNGWVDFSFDQISYSADQVASSYESTSRTLWAGLDLEQSSDLRYGFAFGRTWSDVDANSSGRVSGETTMLMGYYAAQYSHLSFGATVGVGRSSFDTQRSVGFVSGAETALASGDAEFASVSFETAYQRELAPNMTGNLWADVSMIFMDVDGYAETGSALIASAVADEFYRSGVLEIGYEITVTPTFLADDTSGLTTFGFGLRHEFGSDRQYRRRVSMHGAEWDVASHDLSPTSAFAAVGFDYDIGDGQTISGHLSGEGNQDYSSYGAALSFVRRF